MKKGKIPLICRIRRSVHVFPSAMFWRCLIGVRHHTKHCKNCEYYIPNIGQYAFIKGLGTEALEKSREKETI